MLRLRMEKGYIGLWRPSLIYLVSLVVGEAMLPLFSLS